MKSCLLPESQYSFRTLTLNDIKNAYEKNLSITGIVDELSEDDPELIVDFGGISAHLPVSEVTVYDFIYPLDKSKSIPIQIYTILGKKIRVKVTSMEDNKIYVSRKANLIAASDYLNNCEISNCQVTSLTSKYAFCDAGDGICSIIRITDICKTRIKNVSEYFHVGDCFSVKIIGADNKRRFLLSYKDMYKKYSKDDYKIGDCVSCTVKSPVENTPDGLYVSITPQVCGILNVKPWNPTLNYGDNIEASIVKVKDQGLKLKFIKKVDK